MTATLSLLEQARLGLPVDLRQRYFSDEAEWGIHLAVMREPYLTLLLDGQKTIESRFSLNRMDPFERVSLGDLVLLKAGAVVGAFVVGDVEFKELFAGDIDQITRTKNRYIQADESFWALKHDARFASLLSVERVYRFEPFTVSKRDMRGWVVLRARRRELTLAW